MSVELCGAGDAQLLLSGPQGLGVLYDRHARAVLRLAIGIVGDDEADEVVQETFLLAWRKRRTVTIVGDSALPWLLTTARLEALSLRRRALRRASRSVPLSSELHDRAVPLDDGSVLQDLLAGLSAADREVVEVVLVEGLSYAEAAVRLGVTVTTVGKRLQRARGRARVLLQRELSGPEEMGRC